jgi:hypothetical protein
MLRVARGAHAQLARAAAGAAREGALLVRRDAPGGAPALRRSFADSAKPGYVTAAQARCCARPIRARRSCAR